LDPGCGWEPRSFLFLEVLVGLEVCFVVGLDKCPLKCEPAFQELIPSNGRLLLEENVVVGFKLEVGRESNWFSMFEEHASQEDGFGSGISFHSLEEFSSIFLELVS